MPRDRQSLPKDTQQRSWNPRLLAFRPGVFPRRLKMELVWSPDICPICPRCSIQTPRPLPGTGPVSQLSEHSLRVTLNPSSLPEALLPSSPCSSDDLCLGGSSFPFPQHPLPTPSLGPAEMGAGREGGFPPHFPVLSYSWTSGRPGPRPLADL